MKQEEPLPVIGWREWLDLPDLGIRAIKVKVDTGARSSTLHAFGVESFQRENREMVRFQVHPYQKNSYYTVALEAELLEWRQVRTSSGHSQLRPVIRTSVKLEKQEWLIDLTLTNRDVMGFRMLLGREALRGRFLVDSGKSYLLSHRSN